MLRQGEPPTNDHDNKNQGGGGSRIEMIETKVHEMQGQLREQGVVLRKILAAVCSPDGADGADGTYMSQRRSTTAHENGSEAADGRDWLAMMGEKLVKAGDYTTELSSRGGNVGGRNGAATHRGMVSKRDTTSKTDMLHLGDIDEGEEVTPARRNTFGAASIQAPSSPSGVSDAGLFSGLFGAGPNNEGFLPGIFGQDKPPWEEAKTTTTARPTFLKKRPAVLNPLAFTLSKKNPPSLPFYIHLSRPSFINIYIYI